MDVRRVPWVAEVCKTASSTGFLSGYEAPAPPLEISKQKFPYIRYRQGMHAQGCLLTWFVCRFLVCVCCWYLRAFLPGVSNMMNLSLMLGLSAVLRKGTYSWNNFIWPGMCFLLLYQESKISFIKAVARHHKGKNIFSLKSISEDISGNQDSPLCG